MSSPRKLETLPYSYRWFNGVILNDYHTDYYNRLTEDVRLADAGGFQSRADDLELVRNRQLNALFSVYLDNSQAA